MQVRRRAMLNHDTSSARVLLGTIPLIDYWIKESHCLSLPLLHWQTKDFSPALEIGTFNWKAPGCVPHTAAYSLLSGAGNMGSKAASMFRAFCNCKWSLFGKLKPHHLLSEEGKRGINSFQSVIRLSQKMKYNKNHLAVRANVKRDRDLNSSDFHSANQIASRVLTFTKTACFQKFTKPPEHPTYMVKSH